MGIPNFIKLKDIFSEANGLILPTKKPIIKKGTISINKFKIDLKYEKLNFNLKEYKSNEHNLKILN